MKKIKKLSKSANRSWRDFSDGDLLQLKNYAHSQINTLRGEYAHLEKKYYSLSPTQKIVFFLAMVVGDDSVTIGDMLGITQKTVTKHIFDAQEKLGLGGTPIRKKYTILSIHKHIFVKFLNEKGGGKYKSRHDD